MAILSNINDLFRVDSAGAVYFATSAGANLQVLQSVGTGGSPIWVDVDDIIGGPYLPLDGGTLTGNLALTDATNNPSLVISTGTLTVGGATTLNAALTGTSATFAGNINIPGTNNSYLINSIQLANWSYFGYSTGYPGIVIGNTGQQSLFFNVDPVGNPSGGFNGGGMEYVYRNVGSFITPNATNNGYNTILGWNTSGDVTLSNNTTLDGNVTITGNLFLPTAASYIKLGGYSFIGEDLTDADSLTIASHYSESIYFAHENAGVYTTTMRIDPSGNLTVGNSSYGSSLGQVRIINDAASSPANLSLFGYNNVADGGNYASIDLAMQSSGTGGNVVASIRGLAEGTGENASDLAFYTATSGTLSKRMHITSVGRIGIGEDNPSTLLSLKSSANGSLGGISLIGNTAGDKSNIWTQDIYSKWLHTESAVDAAAGYGRIDFETNAALNATYPTRGGFSFKTAGAGQFVTFTSEGKVGIGTSLPNRKLNVQGSSSYTYPSGIDNNSFFGIANNGWAGMNIFATPTTGGFIDFGDTDAGWRGRILYSHADDSMAFSTSAVTRMRVQSNGSVGIGIDTATSSVIKLRVVGNENSEWTAEIKNTNTAGNTYGLVVNTLAGAGTYNLGCYTHTGNGFFVQNDGKVAIGIGTASQGRLHVTQGYSASLRVGYFQTSAYSAPHVAYDTFAINQQDVPSLVLVETPAAAVSTHQKLSITVGDNNCVFRTSQVSGGIWFNVNGNVSSPGYQTTVGTNAIRILNNADVGIGTPTPTEKLSIKGDNQSVEEILRVRTGNSTYSDAGASLGVAGYEGEMNVYDSANVKRIYLSSHYNCYINPKGPGFTFIGSTTGPNAKLYVEGSSAINAARFYGTGGTVAPLELRQNNTAGWFTKFYSDNFGTYVGGISFYGSTTTFNTSSDYRLKENIIPISDSITRLKQLKPSRFNFKQYPEITIDGFLAHEVQDIVPEAVTGDKDELDLSGKPVYQAIDHSRLIPLLVASIQELEARVKELENK